MGVLIDFLVDNYIYFLFVAILLVLALIGYIVDSTKTAKLKKEFAAKEEDTIAIPIANLSENVKIGETVNKMANKSNASVNGQPPVKLPDNPSNLPKAENKK